QAYGTPNYYVQKLYSNNKGTNVVPALLNGKAVSGQDSLYASAVIDKNKAEVIIKVVNASGKEKIQAISLEGIKKMPSQGLLTVLESNDPHDVNSFDMPQNVAPKESTIAIKGKQIILTAAPNSFSVIRVKM
ncbi:MAG: alpha-L-arabinofuranosidase C-terminal domain-containing protein, partial [Ferruginibacter sp.]